MKQWLVEINAPRGDEGVTGVTVRVEAESREAAKERAYFLVGILDLPYSNFSVRPVSPTLEVFAG